MVYSHDVGLYIRPCVTWLDCDHIMQQKVVHDRPGRCLATRERSGAGADLAGGGPRAQLTWGH